MTALDEIDAYFPAAGAPPTTLADIVDVVPAPRPAAPAMAPLIAWPPPRAELALAFTVLGEAKPAGSKTSGVAYKGGKPMTKNGKIVTFTKDSSGAKGKAWRQEVAGAAFDAVQSAAIAEPLRGMPLALEVVVFRPRPDAHYGSGRNAGALKGSAPPAPITRPDVLKLARAIEDSLTSIVWHDDSQIVDERLRKVYGSPARAEVRVWRLPASLADARAAAAAIPQPQRALFDGVDPVTSGNIDGMTDREEPHRG